MSLEMSLTLLHHHHLRLTLTDMPPAYCASIVLDKERKQGGGGPVTFQPGDTVSGTVSVADVGLAICFAPVKVEFIGLLKIRQSSSANVSAHKSYKAVPTVNASFLGNLRPWKDSDFSDVSRHQIFYDAQTIYPANPPPPVVLDPARELRRTEDMYVVLSTQTLQRRFSFQLPPLSFCQDDEGIYKYTTNWHVSAAEKLSGGPPPWCQDSGYDRRPCQRFVSMVPMPPTFSTWLGDWSPTDDYVCVEYFLYVKTPLSTSYSTVQSLLKPIRVTPFYSRHTLLSRGFEWKVMTNTKSDFIWQRQDAPDVKFSVAAAHYETNPYTDPTQPRKARVMLLTHATPFDFQQNGRSDGSGALWCLTGFRVAIHHYTEANYDVVKSITFDSLNTVHHQKMNVKLDFADLKATRFKYPTVFDTCPIPFALDLTPYIDEFAIKDIGHDFKFCRVFYHTAIQSYITLHNELTGEEREILVGKEYTGEPLLSKWRIHALEL